MSNLHINSYITRGGWLLCVLLVTCTHTDVNTVCLPPVLPIDCLPTAQQHIEQIKREDCQHRAKCLFVSVGDCGWNQAETTKIHSVLAEKARISITSSDIPLLLQHHWCASFPPPSLTGAAHLRLTARQHE